MKTWTFCVKITASVNNNNVPGTLSDSSAATLEKRQWVQRNAKGNISAAGHISVVRWWDVGAAVWGGQMQCVCQGLSQSSQRTRLSQRAPVKSHSDPTSYMPEGREHQMFQLPVNKRQIPQKLPAHCKPLVRQEQLASWALEKEKREQDTRMKGSQTTVRERSPGLTLLLSLRPLCALIWKWAALDFAALVGSWIWILARRVQITQSSVSVENQEEEQLKNLQIQRNTPIFSIYR